MRVGASGSISPATSAKWISPSVPARKAIKRNSPNSVGSRHSPARSTVFSLSIRYSMRSAMVPSLSPWVWAKRSRSGRRAIVPSSLRISTTTAAARRARSQPASVWPARVSTPPGSDISGKTWPGWTKSEGFAPGRTAARIVVARSTAEMPVVIPPAASMETVNWVRCASRLSPTISFRPMASQRSRVIGRQIRPRPYRAMKLIASGVACAAGMTRSPSFSRSSSSTSTTMFPFLNSAMSSLVGSNDMSREPFARLPPCGVHGRARRAL